MARDLRSWKRLTGVMAVLVFAFGCTTGYSGQEPDVETIKNFSDLEPQDAFTGAPIGFGGATPPGAMPWLKAQGFATVISFRLDSEDGFDLAGAQAAAEAAELNYFNLPVNPEDPDPASMATFLDIAANEQYRPIYMHCNTATRAAAMWMIGRIQVDGLDVEEAALEIADIAEKPEDATNFAKAYLASRGN